MNLNLYVLMGKLPLAEIMLFSIIMMKITKHVSQKMRIGFIFMNIQHQENSFMKQ